MLIVACFPTGIFGAHLVTMALNAIVLAVYGVGGVIVQERRPRAWRNDRTPVRLPCEASPGTYTQSNVTAPPSSSVTIHYLYAFWLDWLVISSLSAVCAGPSMSLTSAMVPMRVDRRAHV